MAAEREVVLHQQIMPQSGRGFRIIKLGLSALNAAKDLAMERFPGDTEVGKRDTCRKNELVKRALQQVTLKPLDIKKKPALDKDGKPLVVEGVEQQLPDLAATLAAVDTERSGGGWQKVTYQDLMAKDGELSLNGLFEDDPADFIYVCQTIERLALAPKLEAAWLAMTESTSVVA